MMAMIGMNVRLYQDGDKGTEKENLALSAKVPLADQDLGQERAVTAPSGGVSADTPNANESAKVEIQPPTPEPTKSLFHQGESARPTDSDGPVCYQWQSDNTTWSDYSPEACQTIQDGFLFWQQNGSQLFVENTIDIKIGGGTYVIEYVNMTQTNDETGRFRKFRNKADLAKPCRWGDACTNVDCHFFHPTGRSRRGLEEDARGKIPCRWGEFCTRVACPFIHPINADKLKVGREKYPCKFGDSCWEPSCDGSHPSGENRAGLVDAENNHCRYGDNCTRVECKKNHPNARARKGLRCKFGDMCRRPVCKRNHPNGDNREGLLTPIEEIADKRSNGRRVRTLNDGRKKKPRSKRVNIRQTV